MDTNTIRTRITTQGWSLREIPITRADQGTKERRIIQYKIIAFRGEKSLEVAGPTLDEAMKNIGKTLGVIPRQG